METRRLWLDELTLGAPFSVAPKFNGNSAYSFHHWSMKRAREVISLDSEEEESDAPVQEPPRKRSRDLLTAEQRAIVDYAVKGPQDVSGSLFITGDAGAGKSLVLRTIIDELRANGDDKGLFVTASTGIAASDLGGRTVHSFAGIGLGTQTAEEIVDSKYFGRETEARWKRARTLVIDEVSMLSAEIFDLLDDMGRLVRRKDAPFGGVRIIAVGDLYQLPSIPKGKSVAKFCFESKVWKAIKPRVFTLNFSHRQAGDSTFAKWLAELRRGHVSKEAMAALLACVGRKHPEDAIVTSIMPLNDDVDAINADCLTKLPGEPKHFVAHDYEKIIPKDPSYSLLKHFRVQAVLILKVGAQVMLLKNLDVERYLFNGAIGVVTSFDEFTGKVWVDFDQAGPTLIEPCIWEVGTEYQVLASRRQLPLILAWSISSHKAQGQTISCKVKSDLSSVFDYGQAYVILSRLKSLDQLELLRDFSPSVIKAHPRVAEFYKQYDKK
jgi:ATP-dependent DNA helicase PIF1